MKEIINKNKLYILLGIVIIFLLVLLLNNKYTKTDNKVYKNLNIVFKMNESKTSFMPYINIATNEINSLNTKITKLYYNVTKNEKNSFTYENKIIDEVLEIVIKIKRYDDTNTFYNNEYLTYYIDINNNKIIEKSDFINMFSIDTDNIINKINEELLIIHEKNLSDGYIEEFCDYECFLDANNISVLSDNLVYYIGEENINVYLNYNKENIWFDPSDYIKINNKYEFKR